MLSQGIPPNDRPIFFFIKTLNDTQRRYSTIERELLAIVEAVKTFRVYLHGRFFITDHRPLYYLFNMKHCASRLFRQKLELMDYNFKILYRPGSQNHVADALSRIEPMIIDEMLKNNQKTYNVVTRSRDKIQNNECISHSVEEKPGTILNKRSYDLIFHLIPTENINL